MTAAAASTGFKTREDRLKEKQLLAARKAGAVAPEKDADGKDINPHIPAYIAQAPWYLNATAPGLQHQKAAEKQQDRTWYTRGATQGPAATKYRKGACENCGSLTHTAKACVERPRKMGARWTSKDIRPDEVIQQVSLDYEGKRDRWNGYDPEMHSLLMQKFEKTEEAKRKRKEEMIQADFARGGDAAEKPMVADAKDGDAVAAIAAVAAAAGGEDKQDEDEFGIRDDSGVNDAPIAKMDPRTRSTIRNLRIREDTAKYLRNLDPDSAYYDPKSRSMREDPTPHLAPEDKQFAGDNFVRGSGEVSKFQELNAFAWDAYERGQDVHLQALPSQAELLLRQFKEKKEQLKKEMKTDLLAKYGGEEHLAPAKELPAQSDIYVEYSRTGKPIKGADKLIARSRYEEDVFVNNHTKVWGSWWENGKWGYGCCRQLIKNSFCTGEAGIIAKESVLEAQLQRTANKAEQSAAASAAASMRAQPSHKAKQPFEKEAAPELDPAKLEKALEAEEKRRKQPLEKDERKRAYNSLATGSTEVTEEDMEAYRRHKTMMDDPMRNMKDTTL